MTAIMLPARHLGLAQDLVGYCRLYFCLHRNLSVGEVPGSVCSSGSPLGDEEACKWEDSCDGEAGGGCVTEEAATIAAIELSRRIWVRLVVVVSR